MLRTWAPGEPGAAEGTAGPGPAALAEVKALYDQGRYLQALERSRALGPLAAWTGLEARLLAGRLAVQLGAGSLGRRLHLRARREHPASDAALTWAVRAIRSRSGPWAALGLVRRAGEDRLRDPEALGLRAALAADLRDFEDAERHLAAASALAPESPWIEVERAGVLARMDAYEPALEAAGKALALRPWYRPAVDEKAHLLVLLGRDDEAAALLEEAVGRLEAASTAMALLELQSEQGRWAEAARTIERIAQLSPLRERALDGWLEARRSDAAHHLGDRARAVAHARRARQPFYERLAERLEAAAEDRRVLLPVAFVRQHHLTCAPATLTALARFLGAEARHLEVAEAICYDGTPDHAQRQWAEAQGFVVRELTVTWEAARALLDRGLPFALTTVEPGSAHMQAVVGYDLARGVLLLRDPYHRALSELVGDAGLARYASSGPRGMVLVPRAQAARLEGLALPEADLHDAYHRVQAALVAHDRPRAVAARAELEALAPGHRLALQAARALAAYDGDEEGRLRATEALLALFPDDVNLRLSRQASLGDLGRRDRRVAWLRAELRRADDPLLRLALADLVRADARELPEARRLVCSALRRLTLHAGAYHALGHVLWEQGERAEALAAYRAAACLESTDERYAGSFFRAARLLGRTADALAFLRGRFERQGRRSALPALTLHEALDALELGREALDVLERAVAWRPDDGALLLRAARARAAAGQAEAAEALLRRAEGAAHRAEVLRAAAQLAERRGELAEAARLWREASELEPLDVDAARAALRLRGELGEAAAALADLRARVERFPHHQGLGRLLVEWLADGPPEAAARELERLLAQNPADGWAWRELALVRSRLGRAEAALEAVARAAEVDPDAATLRSVRASVLIEAGRAEEAKEELRAALRTSVDEGWPLRELLRLAADAEERRRHLDLAHAELVRQVTFGDGLLGYQEAAQGVLAPEDLLARLEAAHRARPDLWHAWVALARQRSFAGRREEARRVLREATERFALLPRVWLELGLACRAEGDRAGARGALERAVALSPGWPDAVLKLAELLHGDGALEEERAALARAVRHAPSDPFLRGWLADALWELSQREEAVAELERALRLAPGYTWAWEAYQRFTAALGRPEAPRALAEAIAAERPGDARAWLLVAGVRDEPAGRLEAIERALAADPGDLAAHELRVDALADAGRFDEAVAAARAEVRGVVPRQLRLREARVEARRGRAAEALRLLEALLEAEPDLTAGWELLADWHAEAGRHAQAVEAARRLVALAPDHPPSHGYLAQALAGAGDRAGARAALRRALELDPDYPWAIERLFDLSLEDGELDAAAAALDLAARHLPDRRPLLALRLDARRGDQAAALAGLRALCGTDDARLLGAAADALRAADLGEAAWAVLQEAVGEAGTGRAAGALWGRGRAEAIPGGAPPLLDRLLAEGDPPSPAALGAAEGWIEQRAERATRQGKRALRRFLRRHRRVLQADPDTWGMGGYALSALKLHRAAARWLGGWRGRAGAAPWMLLNLAVSLRDLGRLREAAEVSEAALRLRRDHATALHQTLLAADAALAGDFGPLERLPDLSERTGYYRFLAALCQALRCAAAPDRRAGFRAARAHVEAAAAAVPALAPEPFLRRFLQRALWRIARRRGGPLAPLVYLAPDRWFSRAAQRALAARRARG